jgi:uncharacterized protein
MHRRSRVIPSAWAGRVGLGWAVLAAVVVSLVLGTVYWQRDRIPIRWRLGAIAWLKGISIDHTVQIQTPDGVKLAASVYLPPGERKNLPTVLIRLPYGKTAHKGALNGASVFSRAGFAVVVVDVRGKFGSTGEFTPWKNATADGVAVLDWIAKQPWSNGKVGTFGCSALGELQYALARARHPAHAAMIPIGAGGALGALDGRYEYFGVFEGGVFQLATGFGWFLENGAKDPHASAPPDINIPETLKGLPVADLVSRVRPAPNGYTDFLTTPLGHPDWQAFDYIGDADRWSIPTLDVNTWGDQTVAATLAVAEHARRTAPAGRPLRHHVVIAAGNHCDHFESDTGEFGDLNVSNASRPYDQWFIQWFNHWLRGAPDALADLPVYQFFVIGENRWLESDRWPPAQSAVSRWYLGSAGKANSVRGNGSLSPQPRADSAERDEYLYSPDDPVPSRGGPVCCTGNKRIKSGPVDQRDVEGRDDVLVFTSAPLDQPMRIAGPLRAKLTISSSAPDTDFVARLADVRPDGTSINIQEGALRARYRDSVTAPKPMQPGQTYELSVDMRSIAYLLPRGHRLRLHVTSSSFPRLERNLNTGGDNATDSKGVPATNRVYHGPAGRSYVELPLLPVPAIDTRG